MVLELLYVVVVLYWSCSVLHWRVQDCVHWRINCLLSREFTGVHINGATGESILCGGFVCKNNCNC